MARQRKVVTPAGNIKLRQPDRSAPSEKTLLDFAGERNLFEQAARRERQLARERRRADGQDGGEDSSGDDSDEDEDEDEGAATISPGAERVLESMLWTVSLAMLHFTFDVLVQHQYGTTISWHDVCVRGVTAWLGKHSLPGPIPPTNWPPLTLSHLQSSFSSSISSIRTPRTRSLSLACRLATSARSARPYSSP